MASNCANDDEIRRYLMPRLEIIVEEILAGIGEWNIREINRIVYDAGTPEVYDRTYEFRDAWEQKMLQSTRDTAQGEFVYDPEAMSLSSGTHESVVTGEDIRPYLAEIIYEGLAGDIFGQGFWTKKRNAWEALIKIVGGTKMRTWIKRGAKRAGLEVEW